MEKETMAIIESIPKEVWLQLYNDSSKSMLRQFGRFGEDLAKTLRLVTFPIQYTAYIQDRVDRGFSKALQRVPKERRVVPPEGLMLEIADKLKNHDCESLVGKLYVELLTASMDSERAHQAHPAFLPIIGQLSSDEALFLLRLSEKKPSIYIRDKKNWDVVSQTDREAYLNNVTFPVHNLETKLLDLALKPEEFYYPENFYIYIEHLSNLGLLEYSNDYSNREWDVWKELTSGQYNMWFIELTKFGHLFYKCCTATLDKV
ncbi:TPA: Abi-alpha family protein [Enterobacter roggenkampii]